MRETMERKMTRKEKQFADAGKLHQILKIALDDLAACEKDEKCEILMHQWYCPGTQNRCTVCLAGAVMRQRLKPNKDDNILEFWPEDYPDDAFPCKLRALNELREGDVGNAIRHLTNKQSSSIPEHELSREIDEYDDDPIEWWEQMRKLLADLKGADL